VAMKDDLPVVQNFRSASGDWQLTPPDQRVAALQASLPQPCAMLFDSTSCTGGWKLELPDGKTKTFTGLFLSANWFMRDDLDTVGVKAGCSLHLWTRLDFDGAYTVVTAGFKDRWIILQEQEEFRRFHENVESVACSCGPAQRERDIVDILKN